MRPVSDTLQYIIAAVMTGGSVITLFQVSPAHANR